MSPIKIQATKVHKKQQLLDNLFIYSLTALTSTLLCFSPFLHPLFSCIKVLLVLPTPQITSLFFSSKFLFIVGNLIFVVLIGESKIFTSYITSASDFYYKSLANLSPLEYKKEVEKLEKFFEEKVTSCEGGEGKLLEEWVEEKQDAEEELEGEGKLEEWIEEKQDAEEELDGEGFGLPVEELNKRVDDFIARVQKRRSLELLTYN